MRFVGLLLFWSASGLVEWWAYRLTGIWFSPTLTTHHLVSFLLFCGGLVSINSRVDLSAAAESSDGDPDADFDGGAD